MDSGLAGSPPTPAKAFGGGYLQENGTRIYKSNAYSDKRWRSSWLRYEAVIAGGTKDPL
jgi:hypothetical protein